MKILIRGAGFENKGAEAMLRVVQREIGKKIPDAIFYASVSSLEGPFAYRSGIVPLFYSPSGRMQLLRKLPFASKIPEYILAKRNPDFARALKIHTQAAYEINALGNVDAIIDVSGFAYSDSCAWGPNAVKRTWAWVDHCNLKHKPYILMPQAWGPFERKEIAFLSKKICDTAELFLSRDDQSSEYLGKLIKKPASEIRQCQDIAFCFQGASFSEGEFILKNMGIQKNRPLIGIVPNMRVYERSQGISAANHYVKLLIEIVDHCTSVLGTDVVLVPNEIKVPGRPNPDDRFLCSIIADHVKEPEHCYLVKNYYSSETVKSILGHVDLLIASRFHSLVFALSQSVPVMALGWSHKYYELLKPFGLENFLIDHTRLNSSEVISLIETAWLQKNTSKIQIHEKIPGFQAQVDDLFNEVAKIICKANE